MVEFVGDAENPIRVPTDDEDIVITGDHLVVSLPGHDHVYVVQAIDVYQGWLVSSVSFLPCTNT